MNLKRSTLAQQAYQELRSQIVSGQLPAGQRLLADELAEGLSISQTPVKEALALLERDGLVEGESRRGSVVRRFTAADIKEIYEARIWLETQCIRAGLLSGRLAPAVIDHLRAILDDLIAHAERQTRKGLEEAIRLDREFHEAVVKLGGNGLMGGWHRVILRQTQTIRTYSIQSYSVVRAKQEHAAIVDALSRGDLEAAVRSIETHLAASRDELLARSPDDLPERP